VSDLKRSAKNMIRILFALILMLSCASASEITVNITGAIYGDYFKPKQEYTGLIIKLPEDSSLLDALAAAGGCSESAFVSRVRIKRATPGQEGSFDIDAVLQLATPQSSIKLKDKDIIFVPEIMDAYPAPHYFNRMLFEWAYLKSRGAQVPERWASMMAKMTNTGNEIRSRTSRYRQ
jgi:hypothetical protein